MPKSYQRYKTDYPGVFYIIGRRIGASGNEKIYYVNFKIDGKLHEEKAGRQYRDKMTPAKAALFRGERIEGKRLSSKEIRQAEKKKDDVWTINKLWQEYIRQNDLKGIAQDTSRYTKYIKPSLGNKEPQHILPLDVDRVRLKGLKGKSPQTIKLTLALLRRIVNFGVKKRLSLPLTFAIELPRVNNIKTEDLNPDQIKDLFEAIEKDGHLTSGQIMKMVLYTGMRRSEMFRLKWSDIDYKRGFIILRNPKGGIDQQIPLNSATRELLSSISKTRSPFVFPGRNGKQRTDINHQVNRIKTAAGLPKEFRPLHGLRHVYASMLASSGQVDLYTLQKLLTHKDPKMTQRYAHLRDDTLKKASDLAGDIISVTLKTEQKEEKEKGSKA